MTPRPGSDGSPVSQSTGSPVSPSTGSAVPPFIDAERLGELCGYTQALAALERAFLAPTPVATRRPRYELPGGELLVMPAWNDRFLGVKLSTVAPGNPGRGMPRIQGIYALFDARDLSPRAFVDAAALTVLRTAALSALATDRLAVPGACTLGLFGTGPQAYGHLEAMLAVRPISRVVVAGRRPAAAARLAEHARGLGVDATVGTAAGASAADVICTCTSSRTPVVVTERVSDHAHLNVIGSHREPEREIDGSLLARATVVVDSTADAWASGDLALALAEGAINQDAVRADLAQVLRGEFRADPDAVTVFKSVGTALADLAVAEAAVLAAAGSRPAGSPAAGGSGRPGRAPELPRHGGG